MSEQDRMRRLYSFGGRRPQAESGNQDKEMKETEMNRTYKLFIFDFDGTLGDTKECVVASFQESLSQNKLSTASRDQIIHLMGLSLKDAFKKLTAEELEDATYEKLVEDYRSVYGQFLTQKTLIFPEVAETLEELKRKNVLIAIATSKKTEFARLSCEHLHIDKYIDFYIGDDMVSQKKPHPEMLTYTLNELKTEKQDAVMIGDSTYDIEMGNAIGMETIAVTWGAHPLELLRSANPTHIIHKFSELKRFG